MSYFYLFALLTVSTSSSTNEQSRKEEAKVAPSAMPSAKNSPATAVKSATIVGEKPWFIFPDFLEEAAAKGQFLSSIHS